MATSGTEYSLALQSNLKQLIIRNRDGAQMQLSFTSGQSGTNYLTISRNAVFELTYLDFTAETVYLQATGPSTAAAVYIISHPYAR